MVAQPEVVVFKSERTGGFLISVSKLGSNRGGWPTLADRARVTSYSEVIGCWSALADDFRTFLLNFEIFELTLSAA